MTDSPREEPRPDRLPQIRGSWSRRIAQLAINVDPEASDVADLVAEVERLRAASEVMHKFHEPSLDSRLGHD